MRGSFLELLERRKESELFDCVSVSLIVVEDVEARCSEEGSWSSLKPRSEAVVGRMRGAGWRERICWCMLSLLSLSLRINGVLDMF